MALYFKDTDTGNMLGANAGPVLDLAMVKTSPRLEGPHHHPHMSPHMLPPTAYLCSPPPHMSRMPLNMHHQMPPPPLVPTLMTPDNICESAARLLFMNVKWAKNVPAFTALPMSDQLLLLEESWRELFVLGAAQFLVPIEFGALVHACSILDREPEQSVVFLHQVKEFQDILARIAHFHVDPHEFACMRAIVLFKTAFGSSATTSSSAPPPSSSRSSTPPPKDTTKSLRDVATVTALQDHTQLTLNKYISTAQPGQPLRFGKLLLLLPALRTVSNDTIEELFFRRTIGDIPIVRIICDMYKTAAL